MKFVLVIIVGICLWSYTQGYTTEEWADLVKTLRAECRKETGVEDLTIQKVYQTAVVDKSDIKLLKYIQCIATNGGFVDEEGNINEDVLTTHLKKFGISDDVITITLQSCIKKSEDIQLRIVYYYECYRKYLPERVFAV
ncbi:uncharacterized protein LOC123684301 [Harmonia axyridis]|uniref:uncharacterized protein LOC123684301 n=1 Tax=Harmonia axyridis TaxID=115357 RepID=UPI001E278E77|nr:uncharacterized protein LOC123684301 [Harmonia axyridis]